MCPFLFCHATSAGPATCDSKILFLMTLELFVSPRRTTSCVSATTEQKRWSYQQRAAPGDPKKTILPAEIDSEKHGNDDKTAAAETKK